MKGIRVAVFEDNTQLRESLYNLIDASDGFVCAGAFANCENVLQNVQETKPDVILMDIEMPVVSGIDAVRIVKNKFLLVLYFLVDLFRSSQFDAPLL